MDGLILPELSVLDGSMLTASLIMGLTGSLHCLSMCSPLICSICPAQSAGQPSTNPAKSYRIIASYLFTRFCAYVVAGFAAGTAGQFALSRSGSFPLRVGLTVLVLTLLLGSAFMSFRIIKVPDFLIQAVSLPWASRGAALGLATPLIPCGLLWSVLLFASQSGGPIAGSIVLGTFALSSSLPLAGSFSLISWARHRMGRFWPKIQAVLILTSCVLVVLRIWDAPCH